jgi:hypothetical protein
MGPRDCGERSRRSWSATAQVCRSGLHGREEQDRFRCPSRSPFEFASERNWRRGSSARRAWRTAGRVPRHAAALSDRRFRRVWVRYRQPKIILRCCSQAKLRSAVRRHRTGAMLVAKRHRGEGSPCVAPERPMTPGIPVAQVSMFASQNANRKENCIGRGELAIRRHGPQGGADGVDRLRILRGIRYVEYPPPELQINPLPDIELTSYAPTAKQSQRRATPLQIRKAASRQIESGVACSPGLR